MWTLLVEWMETFGQGPPAWVTALGESAEAPEQVLMRLLGGLEPDFGGAGRDPDERLVEILGALPRDGDIAAVLDGAGVGLLRRAEQREQAVDEGFAVIRTDAVFRLIRVTRNVPESLPRCVATIAHAVEAQSPLMLSSNESQDIAGEALQVLATTQEDERYLPDWWRLCDLGSSSPRHAPIGILGLRWALSSNDVLPDALAHAFARIANAAARASQEELMSETTARRVFLGAVRATRSDRRDLPWAAIGAQASLLSSPGVAEALVRRAFGLEGQETRPRSGGERYEDPDRARSLAAELEAMGAEAIPRAQEFLDAQRSLAYQRGDSLPFVQSLCFFASRVKNHRTDLAAEWAREASSWQPHNEYPVVILAETLVAAGQAAAAGNLLLERLFQLAEHSAVWVELGQLLADHGEHDAARECLQEATERFPDVAYAWSALGEYHVRVGDYAAATEAFEHGLRVDPGDQYLVPGAIRALALAGQTEEAWLAYERGKETLGSDSSILKLRRKGLETGDFGVLALPSGPVEWRGALSNNALGTLALLYRRAGSRRLHAGDDASRAWDARQDVLARVEIDAELGLTVSSEIALGQSSGTGAYFARRVPVAAPIRELIRTRMARIQADGLPYTSERFDALTFDPVRAGSADQRLAPLRELSRLRAVATLVDGTDLRQRGLEALAALRRQRAAAQTVRANSREEASVGQRRSTWAQTVLVSLGAPTTDDNSWESALVERRLQLDVVEEDSAIGLVS